MTVMQQVIKAILQMIGEKLNNRAPVGSGKYIRKKINVSNDVVETNSIERLIGTFGDYFTVGAQIYLEDVEHLGDRSIFTFIKKL